VRRRWRLLWFGVVGLFLPLAGPTMAAAHAVLLRATPPGNQTLAQAPDRVQLLFSEPLDPVFSAVRVLSATGESSDNGDSRVDAANDHLLEVSLRPGLPNGVYTVSWRSLSAIDVHPDEGQYPLFVGVPVSTASRSAGLIAGAAITATPETTVGRWWFYVGASLFGGVLAAWKFVLGGLLRDRNPALHAIVRGRMSRLIVVGGVLLILGTIFNAVAQAAAAANVPLLDAVGKPLADLLLRGRYAAIWWPRMGLEIASLMLVVFGGLEGLASESALATLPAVLLTSALTSHGAALPQGAATGIAIDWLHILGATAWVGGLIALLLFLASARTVDGWDAQLGRLAARFGRFALVAAIVVLLSGGLQGALELGSPNALLATFYGQLVLAKVGLLLAMLLLASFNEWRARTTTAVPLGQVRGFRRGVRLELALGVLVLAVAAMLSGTPPSPTLS
jgi:copper transport protein